MRCGRPLRFTDAKGQSRGGCAGAVRRGIKVEVGMRAVYEVGMGAVYGAGREGLGGGRMWGE